MKLFSALFLASRHFKYPHGDAGVGKLFGAVLGVALSLIPLIVVLEVTNGMIEGITNRFIEVGTYHAQVKAYNISDKEEQEAVMRRIEELPGVRRVFPFLQGLGLLYAPRANTGVTIRALPPDFYQNDLSVQGYLTFTEGNFDLVDPHSALLSKNIADKLNVSVGDSVKLLTGKVVPDRPIILRPTTFKVTGVFSTGYHELDSFLMYIPLQQGGKLFKNDDAFSFGIKVENPYEDLGQQAGHIQNNLPGGWYVYTWYELERSMYRSFETTKSLLVFIMVLIVCVAAVNISSTLIMLVLERQHEIAILKCTGTGPGQIVTTYVLTGAFIGILGTFLGINGGMLLSIHINTIIRSIEILLDRIIYFVAFLFKPFAAIKEVSIELLDPSFYLEKIPVSIDSVEIILIAGLTIFLSTAAAYFPALQAGKIRPLDILRKH